MGSFCTASPSKSETSSTQTYTPAGLDQLRDIWGRIQGAASTPYQAYSGKMVADLNPIQLAGINNINNAYGAAMPYFDLAAQYGKQGAAAIDPTQAAQYMSPYTQRVIDATRANFNENNAVQQNQVVGNAALRGALGGDRVGVAQAELARQQKLAQDPTIAAMYDKSYGDAMNILQGNRAAAAQGAFTFGSLAPAIQNSLIQGGQAQIGAGTVAQQNQQQQLNAQYQQYLQALAYPYQQAQFLASTGLPTVTAMGGTQTGQSTTTNTPSTPSLFSQIAGLGLAGAGLMMGGGSNPFSFLGGGGMSSTGADMGSLGYSMWGSNPFTSSGAMNPAYMTRASGGRTNARRGRTSAFGDDDFISRVGMMRQALRGGGPVIDMRRGRDGGYYADGGEISFADRFSPVHDAIDTGDFDQPGAFGYVPRPLATDAPAIPIASVPLPAPRPAMMADNAVNTSPYALPPQITNPGGAGPITLPPSAAAYDAPQPAPQPYSGILPPQQPQPTGPFGLSEDARMGLIAAGLGILGSKNPSAAGAIGEGGLEGLKFYSGTKQNRERNELAARKMIQDAEQFARGIDLREKTLQETKRYHDMASEDRRETARERSEDRRLILEERERANKERESIQRETLRTKAEEANRKREEGKALPSAAIKSLSEAGSGYADFNRLTSTWKPDYGGKGIAFRGDVENWIGRNVDAGYNDQAQWWQDYQAQKNAIRHSLFGSALTATEKAEFDKAIINPGMTPKAIEENLGRQKAAAERAARKLAGAYRKSGYNADAIEAAVGVPLSDIGAGESRGVAPAAAPAAAPAQTKPKRVKQGGHTFELQADGSYKAVN